MMNRAGVIEDSVPATLFIWWSAAEKGGGEFLRELFAHPLAQAVAQFVITRITKDGFAREPHGDDNKAGTMGLSFHMSSSDPSSLTRDGREVSSATTRSREHIRSPVSL